MRHFLYIFSLLIITFFTGCQNYGNEGENTVGSNLVKAEVLADFNATTMLNIVKASIDANATNAFEVTIVKITYKTTNRQGKEVNASGLLVIPTPTDTYTQYLASLNKTFSISSVCDNHGTIFLNSEAPSVAFGDNNISAIPTAILISGYAGFATIMPDYLGYGDSKGNTHPYIMKKSAEASLDMIKASFRYMIDNGYPINGQLYLTGYSEGGYVAMALAKKIEEKHSDEFKLMGTAPMAGPYDVDALAALDLNDSRKMVYPAFLAFIADSYTKYYDDLNLNDMVVKPQIFETYNLFGGDYDAITIHTLLGLADPQNGDYGFNTHYPHELFTADVLDESYFTSTIREKFIQNSVYNWIPKSKINLIQCVDDEIIPFSESNETYNYMASYGADVNLTPIPSSAIPPATATEPFVHQRCGSVAYGAAISWFAKIRSGEIK